MQNLSVRQGVRFFAGCSIASLVMLATLPFLAHAGFRGNIASAAISVSGSASGSTGTGSSGSTQSSASISSQSSPSSVGAWASPATSDSSNSSQSGPSSSGSVGASGSTQGTASLTSSTNSSGSGVGASGSTGGTASLSSLSNGGNTAGANGYVQPSTPSVSLSNSTFNSSFASMAQFYFSAAQKNPFVSSLLAPIANTFGSLFTPAPAATNPGGYGGYIPGGISIPNDVSGSPAYLGQTVTTYTPTGQAVTTYTANNGSSNIPLPASTGFGTPQVAQSGSDGSVSAGAPYPNGLDTLSQVIGSGLAYLGDKLGITKSSVVPVPVSSPTQGNGITVTGSAQGGTASGVQTSGTVTGVSAGNSSLTTQQVIQTPEYQQKVKDVLAEGGIDLSQLPPDEQVAAINKLTPNTLSQMSSILKNSTLTVTQKDGYISSLLNPNLDSNIQVALPKDGIGQMDVNKLAASIDQMNTDLTKVYDKAAFSPDQLKLTVTSPTGQQGTVINGAQPVQTQAQTVTQQPTTDTTNGGWGNLVNAAGAQISDTVNSGLRAIGAWAVPNASSNNPATNVSAGTTQPQSNITVAGYTQGGTSPGVESTGGAVQITTTPGQVLKPTPGQVAQAYRANIIGILDNSNIQFSKLSASDQNKLIGYMPQIAKISADSTLSDAEKTKEIQAVLVSDPGGQYAGKDTGFLGALSKILPPSFIAAAKIGKVDFSVLGLGTPDEALAKLNAAQTDAQKSSTKTTPGKTTVTVTAATGNGTVIGSVQTVDQAIAQNPQQSSNSLGDTVTSGLRAIGAWTAQSVGTAGGSIVDIVSSFSGVPVSSYNSFTQPGGSLDNVTIAKTVNLSDLTRAQLSAMGLVSYSNQDIQTLGKTLAGELDVSISRKIEQGKPLSVQDLQAIAAIVNVAVTRATANAGVVIGGGPNNAYGSLDKALTAGNGSQFNALSPSSISNTNAHYGSNETAYDAIAHALLDGTVADQYGLSTAAPAPDANAYYNPSVSNPSWGKVLLDTVGTMGNHVFGTLPGEYMLTGAAPGQSALNNALNGVLLSIGLLSPTPLADQSVALSGGQQGTAGTTGGTGTTQPVPLAPQVNPNSVPQLNGGTAIPSGSQAPNSNGTGGLTVLGFNIGSALGSVFQGGTAGASIGSIISSGATGIMGGIFATVLGNLVGKIIATGGGPGTLSDQASNLTNPLRTLTSVTGGGTTTASTNNTSGNNSATVSGGAGTGANVTPLVAQLPDVSCTPQSVNANQNVTITVAWTCYNSASADGIGFPMVNGLTRAQALISTTTAGAWLTYGVRCSNGTARSCLIQVNQ